MGIIDTLSAGFSAVNRRLWVIAIPVFLDLFLWLGPKLTAAGPVQRFFGFYGDLSTRSSSELIGQIMSSPDQVEAATQIAKLGEDFRDVNFFNVMAWQSPSLILSQLGNAPAGLLNSPVWNINRGMILVGLILGMALLSLVIQSAYLSTIVQGIRAGEADLQPLTKRIAVNWVRLLAYCALILGMVLFLGIPVMLVIGLVGMVSPAIASLMSGLLLAIALWTALYMFFAVAAMFVSDVDPVRGVWYSLGVVRRHFWSAFGLIILVLVIRFGMAKIWGLTLGNPMGVITAILGHAYVEAGLAAASMIFFRDRFLIWQQVSQSSKPVGERI